MQNPSSDKLPNIDIESVRQTLKSAEINTDILERLVEAEMSVTGRRSRRGSSIRNYLIYVLIIVAIIAIVVYYFQRQSTEKAILPQQIISDARNGLIAKIVIFPDSVRVEYNDGTIAIGKTYGQVDIATVFLADTSIKTPKLIFAGPSLIDRLQPIAYFFFPLLLALIMVWILYRQQQTNASRTYGFARSPARMFTGEQPTITFEDIGGSHDAKEALDELVHFLREPELFIALGARIPKGILLSGPPGCGKTILAKAVSGEAGVPFFSISGSEFVETYMGIGAARVRDLFDQAKRHSPCIVFIDHIDAIGLRKGIHVGSRAAHNEEGKLSGDEERIQTLDQLLVELDGFDTDTNVILIGTTERPDLLDPALLRAGRFDRHIRIDLPDRADRVEVLKVHIRGKPIGDGVDLGILAQKTERFSAADIELMVNDAAILAAERKRKTISIQEFEDSITRIRAERSS